VIQPPLQIPFVRAVGDQTALTNTFVRAGYANRPYSGLICKSFLGGAVGPPALTVPDCSSEENE
jgi:hypothetical protein